MYTLLIADDEAPIRKGLMSLDWGAADVRVLAEADNGMDAVELLQSEMVDVVLSDIRMPGKDGLDVARFVHEKDLYTAVVLLSGYGDFEYARSAIQYGVHEYLLKPSSPEEVVAAVRRACEHVGQRKEKDARFRLMEAELGRRQLVAESGSYTLGETENTKLSDSVLRHIGEHHREQISLTALSEAFHFSTTYLSKVIKRSTGYTFLEILNAVRVREAAAMLRHTDDSFAVICAGVGIEDPRYFSQVFKKYYGVTPSGYKKSPCAPTDVALGDLARSIGGEGQ